MGIFEILMKSVKDDRLENCSEDVIQFDKASDKIGANIEKLSIKEISVVYSNLSALESTIIRRLIQEAKKKESKED